MQAQAAGFFEATEQSILFGSFGLVVHTLDNFAGVTREFGFSREQRAMMNKNIGCIDCTSRNATLAAVVDAYFASPVYL
jgi:hypothetical protein